jgi:hypothetical protein
MAFFPERRINAAMPATSPQSNETSVAADLYYIGLSVFFGALHRKQRSWRLLHTVNPPLL